MTTAESFDNVDAAHNSEIEGVSMIKKVRMYVAEENEVTRTEINNLKISVNEQSVQMQRIAQALKIR